MIGFSASAQISFWSRPKDSYHRAFQKVLPQETKYLFFTCNPGDRIFEATCKVEFQQLTQAFAHDFQ